MRDMKDLKIEHQYSDRYYSTVMIEGFSVEETNEILNRGSDALCELLEKHGYGDIANCWHNGYGIYGIKHFGGHLLVKTGNNCD